MLKRNILKNIKKIKIGYIGAVLCVLSIIFIILAYSKYTFHSDCMGFLLQAKEQAKQTKLFPDRFHYSTGVFGFTTSLFMLPFVSFIQNDYLLHEIGSIIALIVLIILIWGFFWKNKRIAAIVTCLFCLPLSYTYEDMLFFQSAYICTCILIMLNIVSVIKLWEALTQINKKRKKIVVFAIFYALVVFFTNYAGISNYVYVEIPLFCSVIFLMWKRFGICFKKWLSEKNAFIIIGITFLGMLLAMFFYTYLCKKIGFSSSMLGGMTNPEKYYDTFLYVLPNILSFFGISSSDSLLSLSTIKSCIGFLYLITMEVIAPIVMLKNLGKFKVSVQFVVLFSVFLNYMLLFMIFFAGMSEGRYFLPAMLTGDILVAYYILYLTDNYKNKVGRYLYVLLGFFSLSVHGCYYGYAVSNYDNVTFEQMIHPTQRNDIVDFLKEHQLDYGYATFWYAYSNMANANSEITFAAYDMGNPLLPYFFNNNSLEDIKYYACSEDLYNPKLHEGKCFVMKAPGESIPSEYYEVAENIYHVSGFDILVFEKNINLYEELRRNEYESTYICQKDDYYFDLPSQSFMEKSYYNDGSINILKDGFSLSNYVDLEKGRYRVSIEGCGFDQMEMYLDTDGVEKMVLKAERKNEKQAVFEVEIFEDRLATRIQIENKGENTMIISSMSIQKE